MKLIRQGIFHCTCLALLSSSGACLGATDTPTSPGVEAVAKAHDLRSTKKHKKKKHKKHWDQCEPTSCEQLALQVDHKRPEDREELERSIRAQIPRELPALFWRSQVRAELTFEQDGETVVCTYTGRSRKLGRTLELDACDNGAQATDEISFDTVTLALDCSVRSFAKVHVTLHELEPCDDDEPMCDPAEIDDGDPCTVDACEPDGSVTHKPAPAGTLCGDAADSCNAAATCNDEGACMPGEARDCDDGDVCNGVEQCDPQTGCVPGTPLSCDGGDACTGADQCDEQLGCIPGTPAVVDDDNPCTIDACDPDTGVSHDYAPAGTECGPEAGCDGQGNCIQFS